MKILVSGAGGYIGSATTSLFLADGHDIITLDNFSTGYKQPLETLQQKYPNKLKIYELDLQKDLSPLFDQEKDIGVVVHFGAALSVNESMENPTKYFSNNVCGTQNLLSALLKNNIKKIVFSSTCAVYGNTDRSPIEEDHPTSPTNPYGESKLMIERILYWYGKQLEFNHVILRYFNVCGATDDGTLGDSKKPSVHLMQNAVRGALNLEPFFLTYSKVKTADESPIRDYINVVDLGMAHVKAVDYLIKGGQSEILNIGTGQGNSVLEIVKKVQSITGAKFDLKAGPPRQGEYPTAVASIKKAKEILNWQPTHTLEDSVKSLATWYKAHPQGWDH